MWLILSAKPSFVTAATLSPPPMIEIAPESATALISAADDEIALIRNLVLLLPMLTIAIVDSLIRKIPNSLLLSMIVVQAAYVIYQCVTTHTNYTLLNAGIGFFLGFVAFTIPTLLKVPVGAGDVKYSAVVGLIMYMGCYLQTMATVGILVLLVFVFLKITKRGGMKTLNQPIYYFIISVE